MCYCPNTQLAFSLFLIGRLRVYTWQESKKEARNQGSRSKRLKKKQKPRKPRKQDPKEIQPSDPITNVADEALNEENVPTQSNDPPLLRVNTPRSREDRLKLNKLMKLCTKLPERVLNLETTKTAQVKETSRLKNRVKRLEKKKSRTHGLKRLYKVGLSARVESSNEESLEDQGRINDEEMFDTNQAKEIVVDKDLVDDITLAKDLMKIKSTKPKADKVMIQE
nr:hypothetical protein [Tanacetum cinerariifolium]